MNFQNWLEMYKDHLGWKRLQPLLPERTRFGIVMEPREEFIDMSGINVHLDVYDQGSETTIILLHGVGGNGRLLSFFASFLLREGANVICPDLPGYGHTTYERQIVYEDWIEVGSRIVEMERKRDRRVFLFGLSAGGMLAYNVACKHPDVSGLIATNLLDNREEEVRASSAKNRFQAKWGMVLLEHLPRTVRRIKVPIRYVTNMDGLVNDKAVLNMLKGDRYGAGGKVSIGFLLSMMRHRPLCEPEDFMHIPVLLVHPEDDNWTPVELSLIFFNRLKSEKRLVMLENAGHFPIEEPGLSILEKEVVRFLRMDE